MTLIRLMNATEAHSSAALSFPFLEMAVSDLRLLQKELSLLRAALAAILLNPSIY